DLGLRHVVGADSARRHRERQADKSGWAAEKAVVPLRVRWDTGPADLADRRAVGAAVRRARREDVADAAVPDQTAGLRTSISQGAGRSHRLHAGPADAGAREPEAL